MAPSLKTHSALLPGKSSGFAHTIRASFVGSPLGLQVACWGRVSTLSRDSSSGGTRCWKSPKPVVLNSCVGVVLLPKDIKNRSSRPDRLGTSSTGCHSKARTGNPKHHRKQGFGRRNPESLDLEPTRVDAQSLAELDNIRLDIARAAVPLEPGSIAELRSFSGSEPAWPSSALAPPNMKRDQAPHWRVTWMVPISLFPANLK